MARDRRSADLGERYLRLISEIAGGTFKGDLVAAREYADGALVASALDEEDRSVPPGIAEIARSLASPSADLGRLLDFSGAKIRGAGSRDAGVVYTPEPVARFICEKSIESWLLRRVNKSSTGTYSAVSDLSSAGSATDRKRALEALRKVRLLDSSCGTGAFLQAAAATLCRLRAELQGGEQDGGKSLLEVLRHNVYGLDIDSGALKAARARLALALKQAGHSGWREPGVHLERANALLETPAFAVGLFDIIVGNPPYMRVKSMYRGEKDPMRLKKDFAGTIASSGLYRLQEGNLNLYKLFVERNLSLLREDGSLGLIIPAPFLNEATSTRLRQHLFEVCAVEEIVEIPENARPFEGISQATAILLCHRGQPGAHFGLRLGAAVESLEGPPISIDLDELRTLTGSRLEVPLLTSPEVEWAMLKHLRKVPPFRGNDSFAPVGEITVGSLDETIDREFVSGQKTGDLFIKGVHLSEYSVDLSEESASPRWVDKPAFLRKRPSAARQLEAPRLIGRNTLNKTCRRRLKFAMLPPGPVCGNSVKQIIITDPDVKPFYLLGLLNSSVLNWYFELFCSQNNVRNYSIEALPVPRAPGPVQEAIELVATAIMDSTGETREYLDRELMDALVYELYFMDMRMLSSAVLAATDEKTGPDTFMGDEIRRIIDLISEREGFKITQRVTYRQKGR